MDLEGSWWVGHTKARNEKAFAWDLHKSGIGYFLPMYEKVYVSGGKKRRVLLPVFPSYVFFCGNNNARRTAFGTNRLAQVLDVPDQGRLVRELSYFELAFDLAIPLSPVVDISPGRRCRITSGPLCGVEGQVVRKGNISTILLEVSIIGGGALLEIDGGFLEPMC